MKIQLVRKNNHVHFEASNEEGNIVDIDGSEKVGGEGKGARPMQLLLMGLGGCSAIDIVSILKKQKQEVSDFEIEVDGHRETGTEPSVWKDIHVVFKLSGELDKEKVNRAVNLSMEKYCSVSRMLEKSANITWSVLLNGKNME